MNCIKNNNKKIFKVTSITSKANRHHISFYAIKIIFLKSYFENWLLFFSSIELKEYKSNAPLQNI